MYPLTHISVARRIFPELGENALLHLGSFFPDIAITGIIGWREAHLLGNEIMDMAKENGGGEMVPFALGIATHGFKPKGLDYYSDFFGEEGEGYAFRKAEKISERTAKACGITEESRKNSAYGHDMALVKAHNVVEMAVEMKIAEKEPELMKIAKESRKSAGKTCEFLSEFYKKSGEEFEKAYRNYFGIMELEPTSGKRMGKAYAKGLAIKHGTEGNEGEIAELIKEAETLIKTDYEKMLETSCRKIRTELETASKGFRFS